MKPETVPHLAVATVLRFARAQGYDEARLVNGLSFARSKPWWPGASVPWSDAAELFDRLEACHPDALETFAAHYVASFPILSWAATYVLSLDQLYRLVFRGWGRVWPMQTTVRRTASGFELDARFSRELHGAEAFFRLGAEILRQLPAKFDQARARVDLRATSHECTFAVHLPDTARRNSFGDDQADDLFERMATDVIPRLAPPEPPGVWALTPAEVAVVRQIVGGRSVLEIATELAVDKETIRTHLKRAMAKAGVHRQAELVARVIDQRDPGTG